MLFNSWTFLVFFAVVYTVYRSLGTRVRWQNLLLLLASYFFYAWWDYRFLSLILISTAVDYAVSLGLDREANSRARKLLLWTSLGTNLGILSLFKYFDFFQENLVALFSQLGFHASPLTLEVILPLGISFYTFQTLSYTIDVYRRKISACRNPVDFALFVAFFPQLVAGPIERAATLLPQIQKARHPSLDQIHGGVFLILWGLTKKIVIADNAALIVNPIYNAYTAFDGFDLIIATLAFALQIYGDFSGYTDIARGLAKLMGFELMLNFRLPYFATTPSDFWRRWHISLSSWLRDYLYIPLGGNRAGPTRTLINLFLTMLIGGLWHGARWNFVLWGAFHGVILILYRIVDQRPRRWSLPETALRMLIMFILTLIGWIFFRSESLEQIQYLFTHMGFTLSSGSLGLLRQLAGLAAPLLVVQIWQQRSGDLLAPIRNGPLTIAGLYTVLLLLLFLFGVRASTEFIYFQF